MDGTFPDFPGTSPLLSLSILPFLARFVNRLTLYQKLNYETKGGILTIVSEIATVG